jgi:type II restriction enzyme
LILNFCLQRDDLPFDLKTAKPNAGGFKEFKRHFRMDCLTLATNPTAMFNHYCNSLQSYEPQPYNRWTMRGMLYLNNELKVAMNFGTLSVEGAYQDL